MADSSGPVRLQLESRDLELVAAARQVLKQNYQPDRHGVGAAVLAGSGRIYTGVNIEACCYGPCAEPVALGAAFSNHEREILAMVAVCRRKDEYPVLPPCGNCRQMLLDYAPHAFVVLEQDGQLFKTRIADLLPYSYSYDITPAQGEL